MQTLVCVKPGQFEWKDAPSPGLRKGHSIVHIRRVGICGTDLHAFEGTQPYFTYPRILGHELAGEIAGTDGSSNLSIGDRVTILPYFHCGQCIACRTGKPNCCVNLEVFGVHIDGGMRQTVIVPSEYLIRSQSLSLDELALVEPLAIGAHGIGRADVQPNEYVLIMGAGPIGLCTMKFAQIAGAKVIAMDVNEKRLKFCRDTLNVEFTVDVKSENAVEQLKEITADDMPTVVIDATGNLAAINSGINYLSHGGRYILIGLQKEAFSFNHPDFHKRETTLMSSRNATKADFEKVISSIEKKELNPNIFITDRASFEDLPTVFSSFMGAGSSTIKAMVNVN